MCIASHKYVHSYFSIFFIEGFIDTNQHLSTNFTAKSFICIYTYIYCIYLIICTKMCNKHCKKVETENATVCSFNNVVFNLSVMYLL